MTENDRKRFSEILAVLCEVYNQDITETKTKAYWEALNDIDIDVISQNATKHLKTEKFFPRPSELRLGESDEDIGMLAYNKLQSGIRSFGYYDSIKFDDPVIHSVIELMGGWLDVSLRENDQWFIKDFLNIYKSMQLKKEHLEYIKGINEIDNGARGYGEFIKSPALIGESGKILAQPVKKLLPDNNKKLNKIGKIDK